MDISDPDRIGEEGFVAKHAKTGEFRSYRLKGVDQSNDFIPVFGPNDIENDAGVARRANNHDRWFAHLN